MFHRFISTPNPTSSFITLWSTCSSFETFLVFKPTRFKLPFTLLHLLWHYLSRTEHWIEFAPKHLCHIDHVTDHSTLLLFSLPLIINLVLELIIGANTYTEEQKQGDAFVKSWNHGRRRKPNLIFFEMFKPYGECLTVPMIWYPLLSLDQTFVYQNWLFVRIQCELVSNLWAILSLWMNTL